MRHPLIAATTIAVLAGSLSGCNRYDYFRLTGYLQESFSNKADILFVVDNSTSMTNESEDLARNFSSFIADFADADAQVPTDPDLGDDVGRYIEYVSDRTGNINYQLGVTNTEASRYWGELLGRPSVVAKTDDNVDRKFTRNLICEAACVPSVPGDIGVSCEGSGGGDCADSVTGTAEEGIEAVFMAMCRASENPPEPCFDPWWLNPDEQAREKWLPRPPGVDEDDTGFTVGQPGEEPPVDYFDEGDIGSNGGFLRENSTVIPVVITDEGDQSRRINSFDGKVTPYDEYFSRFPHRMSWAVIGPDVDDGCNTSGAPRWGVDRYRSLVNQTNGTYIDIAVSDGQGGCETADFADALAEVGELLRALATSFPLSAVPVPGTIVVTVEGDAIAESDRTFDEDLGLVVYSDGWSYEAGDNAVVLHGDAVPEFNADVRVYYLPADGQPRDLPF